MFKEIREQLAIDLKTEFPAIEKIDKYRGEFSDDKNSVVADPVCFLKVERAEPIVRSSRNQILKFGLSFKIFVGANTKHNNDALDLSEQMIIFLSNANLTVNVNSIDHNFLITVPGTLEFFEYTAGYEVYFFDIQIK